MNKSNLINGLLLLAAGGIATFGQAPWHWWPLTVVGISAFYVLVIKEQEHGLKGLFLSGWLFGFGYFAGGLWWIANALLVGGNEDFRWVWPLAVAGLPALLACFPALALLFAARIADLRRLDGFLIFVVSLAAAEWIRGHIFTGFPWNLYGYVWGGWPAMMQNVALWGAYGLTLLTLLWAALPGYILKGRGTKNQKIILSVAAVSLFAGCLSYGYTRLQKYPTTYAADSPAVLLVQANISQEDKWNPRKVADNLRKMADMSAFQSEGAEPAQTIIVWPETAITHAALEHPGARSLIKDSLATHQNDVYLMTGLLRRVDDEDSGRKKHFNSLAVLDRDLDILATYDKHHLVPFGEYIPLADILPLKPFVPFESFSKGPGPQTLAVRGLAPFSPLVCYEIIFPGNVAADEGRRPQWLLTVTNDAWYGDSPGPRQHFDQARFRAIEEGLPVVRVANTGISGIVDPLGRVLQSADLNTQAALTSPLPAPVPGQTLYGRTGDTLFLITTSVFIMSIMYLRVRKQS